MCSHLCTHYPLYLTPWGLKDAKMAGSAWIRISSALKGKYLREAISNVLGKDRLTSAGRVEGLLLEQRRLIRTERFHVYSFIAICPYVPITNSRTPFLPDPCPDFDRTHSVQVGIQLVLWFSHSEDQTAFLLLCFEQK